MIKSGYTYLVFYKPYQVLTQFSKNSPDHVTLADYLKVPVDVYPVGRLDKDSEGLLLVTNDKKLNARILEPGQKLAKSYWVQVEKTITPGALENLRVGVEIKVDDQKYRTKPCVAEILVKPPPVPERNPPIRHREKIPTSWIEITLTEGKNRQVRKMCAAVGFPVLRLIRSRIGQLSLGTLKPGKCKILTKDELYKELGIEPALLIKHKPPVKNSKKRDSPHQKHKAAEAKRSIKKKKI